jgi:ribosomal protein S18 acetylase RimI-like enzyme
MRGRVGLLATSIGECDVVVAMPGDGSAVLELRDRLARYLLDHGVQQWNPGELPSDRIEDSVAMGSVYLVRRRSHLIASVTITPEDPLIWGERTDVAGYIHMLMVDRAFAGRGIGRCVLDWSEARIEAGGRELARLDCVRTNARLRRYYEAAGYALVDYREFPDTPRALPTALYEKRVHRRSHCL